MDRLASITAFVRVAESGGFSAAGRRMNLSKATVSEQVQALEDTLGIRLLNRTTRRINLTEAGRSYFERCVQILQDLAEADEAASVLQACPRGQLRIYCHEALARFVAPAATDFLVRHRDASIDLRTGFGTIDLMQEGYDLLISPYPPLDASLVRRHLCDLQPIVCASPAYLEKHPAPRTPADLANHNCLLHPTVSPLDEWRFLDPDGNAMTAHVSGSLISNSPEIMRTSATAGVGLIMTAPFLIPDLLESGALVQLLNDYRVQPFEINALYPHRRHLSASVRVFIDLLVDRFTTREDCFKPAAQPRFFNCH